MISVDRVRVLRLGWLGVVTLHLALSLTSTCLLRLWVRAVCRMVEGGCDVVIWADCVGCGVGGGACGGGVCSV